MNKIQHSFMVQDLSAKMFLSLFDLATGPYIFTVNSICFIHSTKLRFIQSFRKTGQMIRLTTSRNLEGLSCQIGLTLDFALW